MIEALQYADSETDSVIKLSPYLFTFIVHIDHSLYLCSSDVF